MKDFGGELEYKGRKYKLVFNLNVMEAIQNKYGSIEKWGELTDGSEENNGEPNVEATVFGLTEMINEGIDIENDENGTDIKFFTLKQVGRIVTEVGLNEVLKELNQTVIESTKSDEKNA